ncbi:hypothetical protein [Peribacillus simplex]|uniref:hypothetical protein n=1 Tax=Peribacillus simplex TaxID=1478 RepID=UPI0024C1D32A|nr:hypothetical protein [Peribacillus simplex]WHZ00180.1 hypothetical protein QNH37_05895 [Peribacillus simplex]
MNEFVSNHDSSLELIIEKEFPGERCVGGKYSSKGHSITLYEKDIEIQCERSLGSLARLEEYSWVILTHELGHALDPDLAVLSEELYNTGKSEILYQIEVNAWNIAEGLIPFTFQDLFTFIRDESLEHCTNRLLVG